METKIKNVNDGYLREQKFSQETSKRINLNDLLQRAKDEKAKSKKNNILVFSGVFFSAALVVIIISYL